MIKVSVFYPNEEGKKFDHGYWTTTHLKLVQSLLGPMGLVNGEMEKGVSGTDPNEPA
ncbi:MAG: EthD family reductase, partial [Chloroflexota bacterium]|nr:EthD family reductase [Chloroflexota bacterium]